MRDTPFDYIDRPEALSELCDRLRAEGMFALDMEFASERSYFPRLHLVQVAIKGYAALIDPVVLNDLEPFWDLVRDPDIRKITHAGRQDGEIVYHRAGSAPKGWYDTQVAAALLGMGDQIGYANLVSRMLGVRIKKTERVTDWSQRPLTDAQVRYALDDVLFLSEIYDRLEKDLAETGRKAWLVEELAIYQEDDTYRRDPRRSWLRVSGKRSLDRRGLALLRELAAWREEEAVRRDSPRPRVVSDDVLVEIAGRRPRTVDDLRPLRRLHPRERERSGAGLVEAVRLGMELPDDQLPLIPKAQPEDPGLSLVIHLMDVMLRLRAREHRIAPSYLGTQKVVRALAEYLASGSTDETEAPRLLHGWRQELVGNDLVALFEGRVTLRVDPETREPVVERTDSIPERI